MKLVKEILTKSNAREVLNKVIANGGAPGINGMSVEEVRDYMNSNWESIKESILARENRPNRCGGVRILGIPSVVDRVLQQTTQI